MWLAIYLASFLVGCIVNLSAIALALFLAQVRESGPFVVGLVGFVINFATAVTTFMLARYGLNKKRPVFIFAPAVIGLLYFLTLFFTTPYIFFLLLLVGVSLGFFWPSVQNCFTSSDNEIQIGFYNVSWSAGVILGSFMAGVLYTINYKWPFIITLILSIVAFSALFFKKRELLSLKGKSKITAVTEKLSARSIREVRLLNFLHFFASSSVFFLYPKLGLIRGFSPKFIGSVAGILLTSRFIIFSLLIDKPLLLHPARFIISTFIFFITISLAGLSKQPYMIIIAVVILGASGAFTYHNSLMMHLKYGLKTELHEGVISAATFMGALIAGLLGDIYNIPVAFVIIGAGIFIAGLWHSRGYLLKLVVARGQK